MDAVLVPCKQNIDMMIDSGVRKPVDLIHWGVDPSKFYPIKRKTNRPFTFGHMGALSIRKGTDILVKAFLAAFPKEKDVRLLCKTTNKTFHFWVKDDGRIEVNFEQMSSEDLMERFFAEVDCFVYPTRGEGFGLTIPEAMATGIPAIATGWSGPVEYMREDVGWILDYTMDDAREFEDLYKEKCGQWAIPSFDHLVHLLRHVYQHQDQARDKGAKAAQYIADEWTWEKQIPMFHEALDKYLA
jgi:glycosyltransferase involved in cell wall biosynthesis